MNIDSIATMICKLPATAGDADGRAHCLIPEVCISSFSVTFTPQLHSSYRPKAALPEKAAC
jgi:hypothetical protein|tara:strand:- start:399 stop:581 length:183 start_codon:yes stop_codon:yes gene_type:complete